ncbi:MAG: TolC family protein [Bacteroidales bacterium]|nr:TolC family protein [Bacteroidales bacterium]MDD6356490.1 TolC family protein [Bacteroidales bacterium]
MKKLMFLISVVCISFSVAAQESLTLSLQQCREMALSASEDLQKASNASQQAELTKKIANTAYLPNIEGSATGAYILPDQDMMGMDLVMRGVYMAGISLMQPLYAGGKIMAGHNLAKIGVEVAAEQQRLAQMQTVADADNAYWSYIAVLKKVEMMQSYMAQMDTLYRQTATAVRIGMATENDKLRVESHRSNIRYNMQRVQSGAELCRMALCRIIGVSPDTEIVPADMDIHVEQSLAMSNDFSRRPELMLLQKQVEAGKFQERLTRGDMLPTLGLSVGYLYYDNLKIKGTEPVPMPDGSVYNYPYTIRMGQGIATAMLALKVPICHWGEGWRKVQKAQLDTKNAQLDLQKNTQLLNLEVQQAIRNVQDSYMLVSSAETAKQQAEENLRVTQRRYASSVATLTDLLDAQSQWQQAQSNLIEAQTQYKIYETAYLKAVGALM